MKQVFRILSLILVLTGLFSLAAFDRASAETVPEEEQKSEEENLLPEMFGEKTFLGHKIKKTVKLENGGRDIYLSDFGKNHIIVPETVTSETKIIIFGSCPSVAKWYALNRDAIAVIETPVMQQHFRLGVSEFVAELAEATGTEKMLWFGFSAAARSVMDSLGCFLRESPEAAPQILILADPEVGNQLNFTCIDSKFCTGDDRIELYVENGTRFLCLSKDDRLLYRTGVRKLIDNCEVTCLVSPFKEHSGTLNNSRGIVWNAVDRGIIELCLGERDSFDPEYQVLDTSLPAEDEAENGKSPAGGAAEQK